MRPYRKEHRSAFVELFPGHHQRVLDFCNQCRFGGQPWVGLGDIERGTGGTPAAGAVMALREAGKLQTVVGRRGRVEITATLGGAR